MGEINIGDVFCAGNVQCASYLFFGNCSQRIRGKASGYRGKRKVGKGLYWLPLAP